MNLNYNPPVHKVANTIKLDPTAAEDLGKLHEQLQDVKEPNQVLIALTIMGKPVYQGTANRGQVARRRAKNKIARRSRRASRK
jgi:hypothetical protein